MAPVLRESIDLLERVPHHLGVPATDRGVELVREDRKAPRRAAGARRARLVVVASRGGARRTLGFERADARAERRLRVAGLVEIRLERACAPLGSLEIFGELGHLRGGPRSDAGAEGIALLDEPGPLVLEPAARRLRVAELLARLREAALELDEAVLHAAEALQRARAGAQRPRRLLRLLAGEALQLVVDGLGRFRLGRLGFLRARVRLVELGDDRLHERRGERADVAV